MSTATIHAPAKVNLGLEILGKRDDGFHEIRSVLATISLFDTLSFTPQHGTDDHIIVNGAPQVISPDENLVLRALGALREAGADIPPHRIELTKRIPIAAGMGGASSDAAAVLRFFAMQCPVDRNELFTLAATLGSDVPFFLDSAVALVGGRGETLVPLPLPDPPLWVVTVSPGLSIPAKTASMYAAIEPAWWTPGHDVDAFAATFPRPPLQPPDNVFALALFERFPEMSALRDQLSHAGFPFVAVSGAGPTLYTICESESDARDLARRAVVEIPEATIHASRMCPTSEAGVHGSVGLPHD